MSIRTERINSEMARSLSVIIRDLKDPRVSEMVSVMRAEVTKDLKHCKAFVSIYGDKDKAKVTFETLVNSSGFIRRELAVQFKELRSVPEVSFVIDDQLEHNDKINRILQGLKQNDNN